MDSKFKVHLTDNIFKELDNEHSLYIMGLSLASNDLTINLDSLNHYPASENIYFFSNSISIVREVASLLVDIDKSNFKQVYSKHTKDLYKNLKSDLLPFHDGSIVKSTLKPIRDFTFHYNLNKFKEHEVLNAITNKVKELDQIEIGFNPVDETVLGQRYTFADTFRTDVTNKYLNKEIVSNLSSIAVNIGNFVDSLMHDLSHDSNKK